MLKSSRCTSRGRKPLSDVSNAKQVSRGCEQEAEKEAATSLPDRLLLARADLKKIVSEIDELFIQASENNCRKDLGTQEIEAFIRLMSDMRSSLKSWVPRLKGALRSQQVDQKKSTSDQELDLIVSSSPLVSWRNGACKIESGRQLFLLTPLHKLRPAVPRFSGSSKALCKKIESCEAECSQQKSTARFSLLGSVRRDGKLVVDHIVTPWASAKSTRIDEDGEDDDDDDHDHDGPSSGHKEEKTARTLTSKYPELFGLQLPPHPIMRKEMDETLDWFLSPPKTCILLEPGDEKAVFLSSAKPAARGSRRRGLEAGTPTLEEPERSTGNVKKAGETTLKRELWTRFEAVSTKALHYDRSVFQQLPRNRFLDMLEEVS